MKKLSQVNRIKKALKDNGFVSRNYYYNLPIPDRITRLGAIINIINEDECWIVKGKEEVFNGFDDYIYRVIRKPATPKIIIDEVTRTAHLQF